MRRADAFAAQLSRAAGPRGELALALQRRCGQLSSVLLSATRQPQTGGGAPAGACTLGWDAASGPLLELELMLRAGSPVALALNARRSCMFAELALGALA